MAQKLANYYFFGCWGGGAEDQGKGLRTTALLQQVQHVPFAQLRDFLSETLERWNFQPFNGSFY